MNYLPQPYPLWCAELERDGEIFTGLVVAWVTASPDVTGYELLPVLARRGVGGIESVTAATISGDVDDSVLFLAASQDDAFDMAATYDQERSSREAKRLARASDVGWPKPARPGPTT